MSKNGIKRNIPASVARRFPRYYAFVQRLRQDSAEWVSSEQMARGLGLTSSTVRQDLTHLDFSGISKRGYSTDGLERVLADLLGANRDLRMVIVGAGNLGRALARHTEFTSRGFRVDAIFDNDPRVLGRRVGGLDVLPMDRLAERIHRADVAIGIIAVPAASAQAVADDLVYAGIRGILNLAHVHVLTPPHVAVVDVRIIASLHELSYAIRTNPHSPV